MGYSSLSESVSQRKTTEGLGFDILSAGRCLVHFASQEPVFIIGVAASAFIIHGLDIGQKESTSNC